MTNLIQLQNLCIISNTAIAGNHLSKLDQLIMIEIWNCQNVSQKEMKEALTKMHKLQHIDIYFKRCFDEVIKIVQLAQLNIDYTSVSREGLKHLEGLTCLKIIICGDTKINGKNLIELTKQTATINILRIYKLDVNGNELLQIRQTAKGTDIKVETLFKIEQLKLVNSYLNEDSFEKLRESGIKTYR